MSPTRRLFPTSTNQSALSCPPKASYWLKLLSLWFVSPAIVSFLAGVVCFVFTTQVRVSTGLQLPSLYRLKSQSPAVQWVICGLCVVILAIVSFTVLLIGWEYIKLADIRRRYYLELGTTSEVIPSSFNDMTRLLASNRQHLWEDPVQEVSAKQASRDRDRNEQINPTAERTLPGAFTCAPDSPSQYLFRPQPIAKMDDIQTWVPKRVHALITREVEDNHWSRFFQVS